jgi:hypothetical protein
VELFADFLTEQNIEDPRITSLFAELLEEIANPAAAARPVAGEA